MFFFFYHFIKIQIIMQMEHILESYPRYQSLQPLNRVPFL